MKMLRALLCTFALVATFQIAHAQEKPDAEGFVKETPGETLPVTETMPARNLVAAAYGFIFAALAVWTLTVHLRSRRVEAEIDALRAKIAR